MVKKSSSNTRLYIILGILAFAIIIGTIAGSGYKELFSNPTPSKKEIVYLYMNGCGHCKTFDPVWGSMAANPKNKFRYNFNKYDMNRDSKGKELAKKYSITSAPTIMLLPIPDKLDANTQKKYFFSGSRNPSAILSWANSIR